MKEKGSRFFHVNTNNSKVDKSIKGCCQKRIRFVASIYLNKYLCYATDSVLVH